MAWILHVADEPERRDVARRALAGHHLDEAAGYEEALARLRDGPPYDLALVDLDPRGAELLRILRARHPETRRLVVAGGATAATVVEKYGVEELLASSELTAGALRRAVEDVLRQWVSADARIRRAELWRRYQDWRCRQAAALDTRVHVAEMFARNAGTARADARRRAEAALRDAVRLRERFRADAADLGARIERAAEVRDVLDAADTLEHVEDAYAELA